MRAIFKGLQTCKYVAFVKICEILSFESSLRAISWFPATTILWRWGSEPSQSLKSCRFRAPERRFVKSVQWTWRHRTESGSHRYCIIIHYTSSQTNLHNEWRCPHLVLLNPYGAGVCRKQRPTSKSCCIRSQNVVNEPAASCVTVIFIAMQGNLLIPSFERELNIRHIV